ncbi:MAG: GxxExxY protein [Terriglobia bacterium]|jgi:GxxExxY protein
MDKQDGQDTESEHAAITKGVIGCAFEVINELGAGFLESVQEKALILALRQKGMSVLSQHPVRISYSDGQGIRDFLFCPFYPVHLCE